jgi:hypothetical protein
MVLVTVPIEGVPEKTYKAAVNILDFVVAVQTATADGWQPGQDLPAILTPAVGELAPVLSDLSGIVEEAKDPKAALKALAVAAALGLDRIKV